MVSGILSHEDCLGGVARGHSRIVNVKTPLVSLQTGKPVKRSRASLPENVRHQEYNSADLVAAAFFISPLKIMIIMSRWSICFSAFLFALASVLVKTLGAGFPVATLTLYRYGAAAIVGWCVMVWQEEGALAGRGGAVSRRFFFRGAVWGALLRGIFDGAATSAFYTACLGGGTSSPAERGWARPGEGGLSSVQVATVAMFLNPVWTGLGGHLLLGERFGSEQAVFTALALVGVAVSSGLGRSAGVRPEFVGEFLEFIGGGSRSLTAGGDTALSLDPDPSGQHPHVRSFLFGLLASVLNASQLICSRFAARKYDVDVTTMFFFSAVGGVLFSVCQTGLLSLFSSSSLLTVPPDSPPTTSSEGRADQHEPIFSVTPIILLTLAAQWLQIHGQRSLPAGEVAGIRTLGILFVAFWSWFLLGTIPDAEGVAGGVMVMGAVVGLVRGRGTGRPETSSVTAHKGVEVGTAGPGGSEAGCFSQPASLPPGPGCEEGISGRHSRREKGSRVRREYRDDILVEK